MGGAASASVFDYKYQKERSELRKALILSFIGNPANHDVLSRIKAVRSTIIIHPELCATAAREAAHEFDYSPTSLEAAHNELDRLFTIYETNTILKSVQCRIGTIACPMGHYAPYFGDPSSHPATLTAGKKKAKIMCNICDKSCTAGHNCSYCEYNLCLPCSTIYCCNGHGLKLWTHPESQHMCVVCCRAPITAGYRCTVCDDYDICDLCTAKPGRKVVQQVILDRMADYLHYMETHQTESRTAKTTLKEHRRKMATNAYATTLDLYLFSESLHAVKDICMHEVFITRTTKEVLRLRAILSYGTQYSVTAMQESLKEGNFTAEEITRLRILVEWSEREKSVAVRTKHLVACPLGHAAHHFTGRPLQYLRRDAETNLSQRVAGKKKNLAICKICDRVCAPEGFHCDFCEYDLCTTCAVIYCTQGHAMHMWTVPEATDACCVLCDAKNLQSGYHCNICQEDVCDWSTSREGRGDIRVVWEKEMHEIIAFMKANKRLSGVAHFYNWRHSNYIVSLGLLCEYVRELRTAKKTAEAQIDQKPIIDKIKEFRAEIAHDIAFSAMAVRETAKPEHYIFSSRKKALAEATRLQDLLQQGYLLASTEKRAQCGIACPLGHGMSAVDSVTAQQPYPPMPTPARNLAARAAAERKAAQSAKPTPGSLRDGVQKHGAATSASTRDASEDYANSNERFDVQLALGLPVGASGRDSGQQIEQREVDVSFREELSPTTTGKSTNLLSSTPKKSASFQDQGEGDDGSRADESVLTDRTGEPESGTSKTARALFNTHTPSQAQMLAPTSSGQSVATADTQSLAADLSLAMSDIYSEEDEETRLRNQQLPRMCRVCASEDLHAGHFCPLCEYDLCGDCSIVYCRLGHPLKIWTFPEATTLSCDMCKKSPIQAGYRCVTCDVDVCDMCTTQDSRNAFMLWPRRELKRVMALLEDLRGDSEIARRYLEEQAAQSAPRQLNSMSVLCKKLKEAEAIKLHADEEISVKKLRLRAKHYGKRGPDL